MENTEELPRDKIRRQAAIMDMQDLMISDYQKLLDHILRQRTFCSRC
jgi:hypothetical protein